MVWNPRKAAFRAGMIDGSYWDDPNIGTWSVAFGEDTTASGNHSAAFGDRASASGPRSAAFGVFTTASGSNSLAFGVGTTASGDASTAFGNSSFASGFCGTAFGQHTRAESGWVAAMGSYNVGGGNPSTWITTDPLFEIGNGTGPSARSNALTVLKNGSLGLGTTAPDSLLHVHASSAGAVTAYSDSVLTLERNGHGYVSILTPNANERGILFGEPSSNVAGGIFYNSPDMQDGLDFRTNGNVSRMTISSAGRVGIARIPDSTTGNAFEVEGNASKTTAGNWLANSDRRIKTDVRELDGALAILARIRPVAFRYTAEYKVAHPSIEDKDYYNVIAQEFAEVFPDYVRATSEDGILQVDTYPALIHALAAVKELHAIVDETGQELATLRQRLECKDAESAALAERLDRLERVVTAASSGAGAPR